MGVGTRRRAGTGPPAATRAPPHGPAEAPAVTARTLALGARDIITCRWDPADAQPERPGGPGQQWRRGLRRLRGGLSPALQRGLWLRHFPSLESTKRVSAKNREFQPVLRSPARQPPRLGFAATSPRHHCACAGGERCAPAEPIGSCSSALLRFSLVPWICLHGNLLCPSLGLAC